ncbi:MAG: hypothetical protein IJ654_08960 [Bacteroidales bacterium]|nr:hypothetical protein [Bacteroidales bacterium]
MRKLSALFLLSAGILLAGCQETPVRPDDHTDGQGIALAVVSGNPATRTAFSGEGTGTPGNLTWERIDWVEGDQILIWSDYATVREGGNGHAATYTLTNVHTDGDKSRASLSDPAGTGLRYVDGQDSYTFWGLYPASAVSTAPTEGSLSFIVPETQTGEKSADATTGNITYAPDMNQAVMLAAIEGAKPNQKVDIPFYPAYTVFEISLLVDPNYTGTDPVYLHHLTLTSSSDLAGTVSASLATGTRTFTADGTADYAFATEGKTYTVGASTYTPSATAKTVTFNLPEAVVLEKDKTLKLTLITLPQNVNDLTIGMYMGEDGSDVRTGTLKTGTGTAKKNLAFAACQKHNLRGVLLKPHDWEFSLLTFNFENPWEKVEFDTVSSQDYPQSTQFEPTGDITNLRDHLRTVNNVSAGYNGYRQCWIFTQDGTATVTFKVMLPAGGSWKVEPQGDVSSFVISPALTGEIGNDGTTRVTFTLSPADGAFGVGKDPKAIYFKTFVTNSAGTTYSLDSETQLYDMRGYHYFIINTADAVTVDGLINQ